MCRAFSMVHLFQDIYQAIFEKDEGYTNGDKKHRFCEYQDRE